MAVKRRRRQAHFGEVTKRDFAAIAEILCSHGASEPLKRGLAAYFKSNNPRFEASRFLRAASNCPV